MNDIICHAILEELRAAYCDGFKGTGRESFILQSIGKYVIHLYTKLSI